MGKVFTAIIGNPPYQDEVQNQGDRANPVYDKFMDEAYKLSDVVELIHPARFLFNAGQTSKEWNKKILADEHIKVLFYEVKSSKVFPNTDIKGGVAVTLRNQNKKYGPIGTFTTFPELNSTLAKVRKVTRDRYLDEVVSPRGMFRFSDVLYKDHPEASELVGAGSGNMIVSNAFDKLNTVFYIEKPEDQHKYIQIIGRSTNNRTSRYVRRDYVVDNPYIDAFKVLVPEANGSGAIGEVLSTPLIGEPLIGEPLIGVTDTFICIGCFDNRDSAEALMKYLKTKFARAMLGINKVTQHNPKSTWRDVPMQDFSKNSDLDWSKSIVEIDQSLYQKYGLDQAEIGFIETRVKEME